jgi:hypothetical protein
MVSIPKFIIDITERARGDEDPKVGWEFSDLGKILGLQCAGEYAEKVASCLDSAALIQRFDHN